MINSANEPTDAIVPQVDRSVTANCGRIAVCHVSEGSAWAGAEVQVVTLLRALSKCPEIALHAIVLHEGRLAEELRSFGVAVEVIEEEERSFLQVIVDCSVCVRAKNIQVLHSHNYKENLIALSLSHTARIPHLIRTEHGHPEPYSAIRNPKHWCVLLANRLAAKYGAARIVSVSADLGEYWKSHANPGNVTILRNAVDLDQVRSVLSREEAKLALNIAPDNFVIGIAARLECIKRHDLFIATAKYLAERISNLSFIIAGGGRQKEFVEGLIAQNGLQERVSLLGQRSDCYDVLRAMDILLICSDHEGVPMVMLEAMALGAAVVSRKVGGIPEVIRDGVNGILVDSGNPADLGGACLSLLEKPHLRASLTERACEELLQHYSANKHARTMVELYQSICCSRVN